MPKEYKRQLSKDDIGMQARVLLNQFIYDRVSRELDTSQVPSTEELQEPGTPTGTGQVNDLQEFMGRECRSPDQNEPMCKNRVMFWNGVCLVRNLGCLNAH